MSSTCKGEHLDERIQHYEETRGGMILERLEFLEGESLLAGVGAVVRTDEKRREQLLLFGPQDCSWGSVVVVT